jgi:selenide,water dikinase
MNLTTPVVKHLVLVGGGHSHLSVLRSFGMKPMPGLAITLISRDIVTPYSGAMPAFLAQQIEHQEMHIDLRPLAQLASAQLIQAEVTRIDLERKLVSVAGRPDIPFDIISLNIGSRPDANLIKGAAQHALAVKPIDQFLSGWDSIRQRAVTAIQEGKEFKLAIIGGGPASVELAFATQARIARDLGKQDPALNRLKINLLTADSALLKSHNSKVQEFTARELAGRNIETTSACRITEIKPGLLVSDDGEIREFDAVVFATGASIPEWPFNCGLQTSEDGFIEVKPTLQSSNFDFVFASGDAATIRGEERPKSGVYAVRQGKVLAENLRRYATGRRLENYFPQRKALALMNLCDGRAIASRGELFFAGRSMWGLKHWIDSRFVEKFSKLPEMPANLSLEPGLADKDTEQQIRRHAMRCAGCGAKVAGNLLAEVLGELTLYERPDVLGTEHKDAVEDASQIRLQDGRILIQSVDYLKTFINDPWLFTRIAVNHCLSDIHAMGCTPHSALAMVGLPHAEKRYARQQLKEVMTACSESLHQEECTLLGGHTAETATLEFGLCVNGFAEEGQLLRKSGASAGESLIMTKALGTGTLLAADMRGLARHEWMKSALEQMLVSNRRAVSIIVSHGAKACTDITGFGFAGHLLELLEASACDAEITLDGIKSLPGATETLGKGIISSLHEDNSLVEASMRNFEQHARQAIYPLLFDPQTAGGLLFSLPAEQAEKCQRALHDAGYTEASIVGKIIGRQQVNSTITLI